MTVNEMIELLSKIPNKEVQIYATNKGKLYNFLKLLDQEDDNSDVFFNLENFFFEENKHARGSVQ